MSSRQKIDLVFIEKINHRFKRSCGNRQASGLTNCLEHIVATVHGTARAEVDNLDHVFYAIDRYQPRKITFEALWASEQMIKAVREKYPNIQIYVHMHSKVEFLATEGHGFHSIHCYRNLGVEMIWNDVSAYQAMSSFIKSHYLPNTYSSKFLDKAKRGADNEINVACYGSMRPMKNHLNQAIAAIKWANAKNKKLKFYVNMGRSEGGDGIRASLKGLFLLNPQHSLISMPWMDQTRFIEHLNETIDIGLQVSMSETFNLVAADYVAAGIPVVVSKQIYWADDRCKAEPHSPESIASTMESVMTRDLLYENRTNLNRESNNAKNRWEQFIKA